MQFRKAQNRDFAALVKLQNQNSIAVDAALDRADGVLASTFSVEDFAAINRSVAIAVCTDNASENYQEQGESGDGKTELLGFACASIPELNRKFGLPNAMLARFDQSSLEGRLLSDYNCAITGPICVDKAHRGTGIFERLYEKLFELTPTQYDLAVALVATSNSRSLAAHKRIGFAEVDEFIYNETTYRTIAIKLASRSN